MRRRDVLVLGAAAWGGGLAAARAISVPPALAQAKYPDRPIKLVVPFVPGGVNDAVARLWADRVKASLGAVFIENQGGAGGAVGAAAVAHAQPDGYTILLGGAGSQVLNPIGMSKPLYDPIKDFEPVAILATTSLTIVVTPSLPVHTLKELIAYAKANPGKLVYGSAGTGSMTHLAGELFKSLAGTPDIVHVPYKGSGASITDVISGQVPMIVANVTGQVLELHKSGKLRMIAVTGPQRLPTDPEIPTAIESGLPGLVSVNFTGLFAPARTPQPIIGQIAAATASAMAGEEVRKNLVEQGLEPYLDSTPEKTRRFVEEDIARWTPVIRAIGLKLN
jgi:tripartite-type tricarboxylate transporter receptor subunit TctC